MLSLIRHSTRRYRTWLLALAAILFVTALLEAGHAHGGFAPEDDHCTLCQSFIALDKILPVSSNFVLPLLLSILICCRYSFFKPFFNYHFAPIRAPPFALQHP